MRAEEKAAGLAAGEPERRTQPRYLVDEGATFLLLSQGARIPCRMIDLSLEGCRLRAEQPFLAGIQIRGEVAFHIHGIAFRFNGVTKWTLDKRIVGIRFMDVTSRRRDELADVLSEVKADLAAEAKKKAEQKVADPPQAQIPVAAKPAPEPVLARTARPAIEQRAFAAPQSFPKPESPKPQTLTSPRLVADPAPLMSLRPTAAPLAANPAKQNRRAQSRLAVDTSAVILLINIGSQVRGRIQDLSLGGCRIHTDESFPVGIYTRVETEFRIEGLPFRLGGVIQAIHDQKRQLVGIRFLDMSPRKREQLELLIEEINEAKPAPGAAEMMDSGKGKVETRA